MGGARAAARARRMGMWRTTDRACAASRRPPQAAPQLVKARRLRRARPTPPARPATPTRVFVTEQAGRVRVIRDGVGAGAPFLDLTAITRATDEERGLLSIAFAPDYATSGRFYVYLTGAGAGRARSRCASTARSAANPDVADPASGRLLLAIPHAEAANHNGGQLQFGPDGKLWLGDRRRRRRRRPVRPRAGPGLAARQADPARPGRAGAGDGRARAAQPVAVLVRPRDGQLVIGDVGQDAVEEIDVGVAANYGWPCREGTTRRTQRSRVLRRRGRAPVLTKPHGGDGFCSITGGYVVRDPGPADARRPLPLRRLLRGGAALGRPREPGGDAATGLSVRTR